MIDVTLVNIQTATHTDIIWPAYLISWASWAKKSLGLWPIEIHWWALAYCTAFFLVLALTVCFVFLLSVLGFAADVTVVQLTLPRSMPFNRRRTNVHKCGSIYLYSCDVFLPWPWFWPNDLDIWTWPVYSEDITAYQKLDGTRRAAVNGYTPPAVTMISDLFIPYNWTFFATYYGSGVMRWNVYSSAVFTGRSTSLHSNFTWKESSPLTILGIRKLETLGYPTVKTASLCVSSFWHNTGVWRTDGRTDRQICRSIYSACKASFAARCKNVSKFSSISFKNKSKFSWKETYPVSTFTSVDAFNVLSAREMKSWYGTRLTTARH